MHHLKPSVEAAPGVLWRPGQFGKRTAVRRSRQAVAGRHLDGRRSAKRCEGVFIAGAQHAHAERGAPFLSPLAAVGELGAAPRRAAGIREHRSAAGIGRDHDFVFGADVEHRNVYPMARRHLPLRAELGVPAARRFQIAVQAGLAIGAVGHFREGRRLEALAQVGIDVQNRVGMPQHTHHRVGGPVAEAAAVVGVHGRGVQRDEAVVRLKTHPAGPKPGSYRESLRQVVGALDEEVGVAHPVQFVALAVGGRAGADRPLPAHPTKPYQ